MGYRSDIRIRLKKKDFNELKKEFDKNIKFNDLFKNFDKFVEEKNYEYYSEDKDGEYITKKADTIYFGWNCEKWYKEYNDVKFVMDFLNKVDCYSFARLGEEIGDYEWHGKEFEQICVYQGFDDNSENTENNNFSIVLKSMIENYTLDDDLTEDDFKQFISNDYKDLIELRNRLKENNTEIFEEDSITCDHILDYMEQFMTLIGIRKLKNKN